MPNKFAFVNYKKCKVKNCENGECRAVKNCERRIIRQEKVFEAPYICMDLCIGCYKCIKSCTFDAIEKSS